MMFKAIYPKITFPTLTKHWFRRYRYVCGRCGYNSVVMKLTAERHYYRCQLGKEFNPYE